MSKRIVSYTRKLSFIIMGLVLLYSTLLFADDNDFETEGTIQSIGEDSLVVNGFIFDVDAQTKIKGDDDTLFFSDLVVGDYVEIEGWATSENRYYAGKIELEDKEHDDDDRDDHELEIKGLISAKDDSSVVVNDYRFFITAETYFKGSLLFSQLEIGMRVEIEGYFRNDSLFAKKIELEDDDHHEYELEFYGRIDSLLTGEIVINQKHILVNENTKIRLHHDTWGTIADLSVGLFVEVKAILQNDGSLLAVRIKIENDDEDKMNITGPVDSVGVDFILVLGFRVDVDENTVITNYSRDSLGLGDLEKGQRVKVKGVLTADNVIKAYKIQVKRFHENEFELSGTISFISEGEIHIGETIFIVDDATVVLNHHIIILLNQLMVGQYVEIKGRINSDGTLYAVRIKIEDQQQDEVEFSGLIEALTADSVTVSGMHFFVDDATIVLDLQGNAMLFTDLNVNDLVEIKAVLQVDGTFKAVRIKLEDTPGLIVISGDITGSGTNQIRVEGPQYLISDKTVLLDQNYRQTTIDQFNSGSNVTVWAMQSTSGDVVVQAKLNKNSSVTAIEDINTAIPEIIQLHANYPNPFNPETNIAFTVNKKGFSQVQLDVFDITGRKVKTLFNGLLDRGNYSFKWNGTNAQDIPVSSGIFIYRLKSAGIVLTKKMTLIR